MSDTPWVWDSTRRQYFWIDYVTNEKVYVNGQRVPRHLGPDSTAGHDFDNADQFSKPYDSVNPDQSAYTWEKPRSSSGSTSAAAPMLTVEQFSTSLANNQISFGVPNVKPTGKPGSQIQRQQQTIRGYRAYTNVDLSTGVQTAFAADSPNFPSTDSAVLNLNQARPARRFLLPTPGSEEKFWKLYKIRKPGDKYFVVGRVFLVLWVEPAGENNTVVDDSRREVFKGHYGQNIFSKVRRFVVIREGHNYCTALSIGTYRGQGVGKKGVVKSEHVVIYTSKTPPDVLPDEEPQDSSEPPMRSPPIKVVADNETEVLDSTSRLDLGKVYTVHHNVKVKSLGYVHPLFLETLQTQFRNVFDYIPSLGPLQISNQLSSMIAASSREAEVLEAQAAEATLRKFQNVLQTNIGSEKALRALVDAHVRKYPGSDIQKTSDLIKSRLQSATSARREAALRQVQRTSNQNRLVAEDDVPGIETGADPEDGEDDDDYEAGEDNDDEAVYSDDGQ